MWLRAIKMKNKYYNFTLIVQGISEINAEIEDKLFESGCSDATLSLKDNIACLEFDRAAISMQNAIVNAITNVIDSGLKVRISSIEPGEYVTTSEIARRINKSRQYIRKLKVGEKGFDSFPAPISGNQFGIPIYHWITIAKYFIRHKKFIGEEEIEKALLIKEINIVLERNFGKSNHTTKKIIKQLNNPSIVKHISI